MPSLDSLKSYSVIGMFKKFWWDMCAMYRAASHDCGYLVQEIPIIETVASFREAAHQ